MRHGIALAVFVGLCLGAAALGSRFTVSSVGSWYQALNKPTWTPPDWVFGPVWTVLYLMMAMAAWLVWKEAPSAWAPMTAFAVQLALNVAWSGLFFGLRSPLFGLIDIAALWVAIAATIALFAAHSPLAAWLMAPYLAWVSFAGALNWAVWRLN